MDPDLAPHGHIRPLQPGDRNLLVDLVRATNVFTDDEVDIAAELIDIVLDRPDQRDYSIFVYDKHGAVLGYYCIGPTPGTEATFDLYWIAVARGSQGSGIGAALEAHLVALIRSRNGRLVIAETSSTPRYDGTRAFYVRRGYTELSRIRQYYRPDDDLVVFGKYLV
jgi:ribosomal protein S18 acetylase RimI-like enzyme